MIRLPSPAGNGFGSVVGPSVLMFVHNFQEKGLVWFTVLVGVLDHVDAERVVDRVRAASNGHLNSDLCEWVVRVSGFV